MTIPNIITAGRFLVVPAVLYALMTGAMGLALLLFLLAGLSDAVDGIIARRFDQRSALGARLDPLADKLLLVSVYIVLGALGHLPPWLILLVVLRDVLILAAVAVAARIGRPVTIAPLFVSKVNTTAQIALALLVLAELAFAVDAAMLRSVMIVLTAGLTVLSGASYLVVWTRHMTRRTDGQ